MASLILVWGLHLESFRVVQVELHMKMKQKKRSLGASPLCVCSSLIWAQKKMQNVVQSMDRVHIVVDSEHDWTLFPWAKAKTNKHVKPLMKQYFLLNLWLQHDHFTQKEQDDRNTQQNSQDFVATLKSCLMQGQNKDA